MNNIKRNWAFLLIGFVSILLAVAAIYTATKLKQTTPIAPTVPQAKPQALEGNPVTACTKSFTLSQATPSPTPSATPGTTPTPTPAATPTPTPSPKVTCNSACNGDNDCESSLICTSNRCRNPNCSSNDNCNCTKSTPTPTPLVTCNSTCSSDANCTGSLICVTGFCRNPNCSTKTDCSCTVNPSPTPFVPKVPVSGSSWPTVILIVGGTALLILGLGIL